MKRRQFVIDSALAGGGIVLLGGSLACRTGAKAPGKSRVVAVAADDMLTDLDYNAAAVHRAFDTGLRELTGEKTLRDAWASLPS